MEEFRVGGNQFASCVACGADGGCEGPVEEGGVGVGDGFGGCGGGAGDAAWFRRGGGDGEDEGLEVG